MVMLTFADMGADEGEGTGESAAVHGRGWTDCRSRGRHGGGLLFMATEGG